GSEPTSTTRRRWPWCATPTCSLSRPPKPPTCAAVLRQRRMSTATMSTTGSGARPVLTRAFRTLGGAHSFGILAHKAACAGKRGEVVNPACTSQDGSGSGARIEKSLSVRTHVCTHCGFLLDCDEHAARNILWLGLSLRGVAGMPAAMHREPVGLSLRRSVSQEHPRTRGQGRHEAHQSLLGVLLARRGASLLVTSVTAICCLSYQGK